MLSGYARPRRQPFVIRREKNPRKSRIKAYWKAGGYLQLAMHTIIKNVYRCWFVSSSPPLVGILPPLRFFFSTASCLLLFQFNYQGNVLESSSNDNDRSHVIHCFDRDNFSILSFFLINLIKVLFGTSNSNGTIQFVNLVTLFAEEKLILCSIYNV